MTRYAPLTPIQVEESLLLIADELDKLTHEKVRREMEYVDREVAYKRAYHKALLDADGTVKEKESIATLRALHDYRDMRVAEVAKNYARDQLENKRGDRMGIQTIAKGVDTAYKFAGGVS